MLARLLEIPHYRRVSQGSCEFCVSELSEFLTFKGLVAGQWGWLKFEGVETKFIAERAGVPSGKGNILGVQQQRRVSFLCEKLGQFLDPWTTGKWLKAKCSETQAVRRGAV